MRGGGRTKRRRVVLPPFFGALSFLFHDKEPQNGAGTTRWERRRGAGSIRGIGKVVTAPRNLNSDIRQWLRDHYGVISWYEARRLGASEQFIRHKLATGEWVRVYRGVYLATATPATPYQGLRAAILATQGVGVISHASGAWLWGVLREAPDRVELTVPAGCSIGRKLGGLDIHRSNDLDLALAVTSRHGMPVTNPLRTMVDLAAIVSPDVLTEAVDVALAQRLVTVAGLVAELGRRSARAVAAWRCSGFISTSGASSERPHPASWKPRCGAC